MKYRVTYELRSKHSRVFDASSTDEAKDMACEGAWGRHRDSIWEILKVEEVPIPPAEEVKP